MGHPGSRLTAVLCLTASLALAGCSLSSTAPASVTTSTLGAVRGNIHGGQQPVKNAHIYLFAANVTGYGGAGIDPSTSNASISLLDPAITGKADSESRGYVTSGDDGTFTITGDYFCQTGQQVYIYAVGGDPGSGHNAAAGFLAILGTCPNINTFVIKTPFVQVNELTTIAAAYAFAGFASDATHVSSSGTGLAQTGIANAFASASNLVDIATGAALATTPHGNGTVPQQEINTLGNILATCVNAADNEPGECPTLFASALSTGPTVTIPTDTATAAINMAHRPANAVSTLFGIPTGMAPFQPALPATPVPTDFTLCLTFTGDIDTPSGIAIDSNGNVMVSNYDSNSVTKLSSNGVPANNSPYPTGGSGFPFGMSIDTHDRIWLADYSFQTITLISNSGALISQYSIPDEILPDAIAVDGNDTAWVSYQNTSKLTTLSNSGNTISLLATYSGQGLGVPTAIAIDSSNNAWVVGPNKANEFSPSGVQILGSTGTGFVPQTEGVAIDSNGNAWVTASSTLLKLSNQNPPFTSTTYSDDSLDGAYGIAVDGANNVWVTNYYGNGISEFSNDATRLSESTGYQIGVDFAQYIAIDGSGNVWVGRFQPTQNGPQINSNSITEIVGAATPVATPLSAAAANNTLATRP